MKITPIKGQMKRKQNTSLLKVANIKKRRTHQTITSSDFVRKETDQIHTFMPETELFPVDQLKMMTRTANEKLINHQHKHASQQKEMISLNKNQGDINNCDCIFCRTNYQWQNQVQTFSHRRISQEQHKKIKASRFNFNMKEDYLSTADTFKVSLKIQGVNARAVDGNFYQQSDNFNQKYISNQQRNFSTLQPNWSIVDYNQSYIPNLKNDINFDIQYMPCYDQKQTFAFFDKLSTFQQASGSMTSSIESIYSDTNNVMTSLKFDESFMTSGQFQLSNNLNYCNYVYQ